ncbi:putative O-methyltransferase [Xylaria bambusicola]|uniref:putative O-methyltransferase n=1 Tax=Xylaria bambusicola TaxID=326684 RepID=UPI002008CE73|nr:putative O-methyltransferase [Xylaria bambusicola]KAI0508612.1 putative O-methyltransferase [Xylaria bambusicola]
MESTLQQLIESLKAASRDLSGNQHEQLQTKLHNTDKLPDRNVFLLASEALNLLSEVRLLLEPGPLILADHFMGYMSTKALCAVVDLNIPDILRSTSQGVSIPELAKLCHARPDRLRQIMQTLHNNGIFAYHADTAQYSNNHVSTLLLSDHWTQWRNWVELYGNEFYEMACGIPAACREDATRNPAQVAFDTDDTMFKYFNDQGWIARFQATLGGGAIAQAPGIVEDYPWDDVAECRVVDIGGGGGGLITSLLRRYSTMKGAIFDVPWVIEQARKNIHESTGPYADVADRIPLVDLVAGDFFREVTPSEVYTIKWCLHDWDDKESAIILRNVRKAIIRSPKCRLVILESVLADGHMGRMSRYGDMNMMVAVGGKERTEMEWGQLAMDTGWQLREIFPLRNAWPCAIEFVPVWGDTAT